MVYRERNAWASLVASFLGIAVYAVILLQQAGGEPLPTVVWWPIMLATIGGSILLSIAISVIWGIAAGMRDPGGVGLSDDRDRDIARMGSRVGQAFLVMAGLGVIVLCAWRADWFWIAQVMFFGFALSALVGGVATVIAYRRGLV